MDKHPYEGERDRGDRQFRGTLTEALGISVSRNAFLRHIIFNNLNYQLDKVRTTKGIEPVFAD